MIHVSRTLLGTTNSFFVTSLPNCSAAYNSNCLIHPFIHQEEKRKISVSYLLNPITKAPLPTEMSKG